MDGGYVSNYSLSTVICHQPDLCGLHRALLQPISTSFSQQLYPLFGGSKLTVNNEILLPAPMYWNDDEKFTGGPDPGIVWQDKHNAAVWRGTATGGRNTAMNWRHFHRHRFLAITNGTKYRTADKDDDAFSFLGYEKIRSRLFMNQYRSNLMIGLMYQRTSVSRTLCVTPHG
jgi:hypothetical protein